MRGINILLLGKKNYAADAVADADVDIDVDADASSYTRELYTSERTIAPWTVIFFMKKAPEIRKTNRFLRKMNNCRI